MDRLAERLVQEGRLDAVPGPEDFRRYREQIRYWTGEGWAKTAAWPGLRGASDTESPDSTTVRN